MGVVVDRQGPENPGPTLKTVLMVGSADASSNDEAALAAQPNSRPKPSRSELC